ncbi:MAG: SHOCT domain-containing protein [Acidimicrobiia bacterium]|nr:MAG: SHOCT domain-containing protein [Acidimicrobiia bacterium]
MWCDWNTMGFFGWTMMVVFWGAVVALAVWAIRSTRTRPSESRSGALDILERRFAAGEIDRDEFEARRALLVEDPEIRR